MKGLIFSIKRYSIHDGPGIRVTFFFKGCPLSCCWCHNPEGINPLPENIDMIDKVGEKEYLRTESAGRYYSAGEITDILEKDRIFITKSDGGVTFSGGEPLLQPEFLIEALKRCKEKGFHTAVDTSGFSPAKNYMKIIPFTDLFLFDLKHLDETEHIKYTGASNSLIINNFNLIIESGINIMVRIPVIPGLNDSPESMDKLKKFLSGSKRPNLIRVSLLPYHKTGSSKYKRLNLPARMENVVPPSGERMAELKEFFGGTGINVRIGG